LINKVWYIHQLNLTALLKGIKQISESYGRQISNIYYKI
jgi:hypothetical protein